MKGIEKEMTEDGFGRGLKIKKKNNLNVKKINMKSLKDSVRMRMANQHLGKAMIGAIAVNIVKDIFGKQCIDGYVSFNKMMIKTRDQAIKIELFKKKPEILERVNQALDKLGYKTQIVDVILK